MILANPFTGMVINANPEGCNQHTGPDCEGVSRKKIDYKERFSDVPEGSPWIKGSDGRMAWIMPDEKILPADLAHLETAYEHPELFDLPSDVRSYVHGSPDPDALMGPLIDKIMKKKLIRVIDSDRETSIEVGGLLPPDKVVDLIMRDKLPRRKKYTLDVRDQDSESIVYGEFGLDELMDARSWKHLNAMKNRKGY
jgi:hypothetical protein